MEELLDQLPESVRAKAHRELGRLRKQLQQQDVLVRVLREEIRLLRIRKFGKSSEKLSDDQLSLLDKEAWVQAGEIDEEAGKASEELAVEQLEEAAEEKAGKKKRSKSHGRAPLPDHLEREEHMVACSEEQCRCGSCGEETEMIGYETSEQLDVVPARYFVRVTHREKRVCRHCPDEGVKVAGVEARIIEKGKVSNRLVVEILDRKYAMHQPLYRQCWDLRRSVGVEISRTTMSDWMMHCGWLLEPVSRALKRNLLAGDYIQGDETTVDVQTGSQKKGNHQAYFWVYGRPGGPVVFDFQMGRGQQAPKAFLGGYNGLFQCDGYSGYNHVGGKGMVRAACLAHVRRYFWEAHQADPNNRELKKILRLIRRIYAVEAECRSAQLSSDERLEVRRKKLRRVMVVFKARVEKLSLKVLPKSKAGKACGYALGEWKALQRFMEYGRLEVDNNLIENAIRPVTLGRKNWLHIGSEKAGSKVAAIATTYETCKRLGIDVKAYLLDILPRIADWPANRIDELTPMAWQAARQSAG